MGVFGKSTKISRAVADPGTDDTLPSSGALSWGGITGGAGLAGTTGADTKLVKGDRWQQIQGNQTENFEADLNSKITGNQDHQVMSDQNIQITGNVTDQVCGNVTGSIIGAEVRSNIGVQNHTFVAPTSRVHAGEQGTQEEGGFFNSIHAQYEWHTFAGELNGIKIETTLTSLEYVLLKTELVSFETEAKTLKSGARVLEINSGGASQKILAAESELRAMALAAFISVASCGFEGHIPPETIPCVT